jgi:hypothetical protein
MGIKKFAAAIVTRAYIWRNEGGARLTGMTPGNVEVLNGSEIPLGDFHFHHTGKRRSFGRDAPNELLDLYRRSGHFYFNPGRLISNPATELVPMGQLKNERSKADSLDYTSNPDEDTSVSVLTRRCRDPEALLLICVSGTLCELFPDLRRHWHRCYTCLG